MNQLATNNERLPMDSVGMSNGATGAKIAPQTLAEVVKFAEVMCRADIALPKHLRGNAGACMAVALQALEWQMSPFAVASKSYSVNGQIAYEAQLIAAVVNTRSGIKGRLKYAYDGEGQSLTCTVTGILDGEEYSYTSPTVGSITTKNSPLWKTDPQQQLGYFSARSWARRYTPEVILGVYDREEAEEFRGPESARDVTPRQPSVMQRLQASQSATQTPASEREGFSQSFDRDEYEGATSADMAETNTNSEPAPSPAGSEPGEPSSLPEEAGASSHSPDAPASDNYADLLARYAKEILHKAGSGASGSEIANVKNRLMKDFKGFPAGALEKIEHITNEARRVFNGTTKLAEAIENVAGLIGVDAEKIGGGNG